ncbi:hypothetical protein VEE57_45350 (plasmid) [Escherichia coli]|nr:hypothetical protein VEE57_45350 [Escherichia coli]
MSADGSTVVGLITISRQAGRQACISLTSAGGMQDLGDLTASQQGYSSATAVSADGSTVVGGCA